MHLEDVAVNKVGWVVDMCIAFRDPMVREPNHSYTDTTYLETSSRMRKPRVKEMKSISDAIRCETIMPELS